MYFLEFMFPEDQTYKNEFTKLYKNEKKEPLNFIAKILV